MATENSHDPIFPAVAPVTTHPTTGASVGRPIAGEIRSESYERRTERHVDRHHDDGHHTRSIPGLIADLSRDVSTLFRQEIELVRAEMREKVKEVEKGVAMAATAGVVALAGVMFVMLALMFALSFVWPLWASALTVGVVSLAIAGGLAGMGKHKVSSENLKPERSARSLHRDGQLVKEQMA